MTSNVENLSKSIWKKGLLVDDELKSKTSQKNLLDNLHIPPEYILFAADYESALEILQKHLDIEACIVDVRIPKNSHDFYDYKDDNSPDWGISLLPKINQLNSSAKIRVYSAQVPRDYIKEKAEKFNNITGFYGKDETDNKREEMILNQLRQFSFDYSVLNGSLDEDNINSIKTKAIKIHNLYQTLFEKIVDIGEILIEVKGEIGYGNFETWHLAEFGMNAKAAQRYMNVAKAFRSLPDKITPEIASKFVPTALFALAKPSVPEAARKEAIEKAKEGEAISVKLAFEITEKHSSKKKTKSKKAQDLPRSLEKVQVEPNIQSTSSKQTIVKIIPRQNIWKLGDHFLFCGDPNSSKFIEQLPPTIALNLAFPPERSWHFSYPHQISSSISFSTVYQNNLAPSFFKNIIEEIIEFTTDADNVATICFCPNPIILLVAHNLSLNCFIAEPDRLKCEAIVKCWESTNSKIS